MNIGAEYMECRNMDARTKRNDGEKGDIPPTKTEVAENPDKPGMFDRVRGWMPKNPFR